jgi:hypothetical protein
MSSAVNVDGSNRLAEQHVLLGGTLLDNAKLRFGVGGTDEAYSTLTPGGKTNRLGIRPMPGITGISVQSKAAYGSLRQVTVNFQCWDISQLEDLELLYMRPGYTVLVEWGWAPYLDNSGAIRTDIPKPVDLINKTPATKEEIFKALFNKSSETGNYDALYGYIKNYSWAARPDGGYDCTTEVISIGEILESLKINYGAFDTPIGQEGGKGLFGLDIEEESFTAKAYSQNKIAGICAELLALGIKKNMTDENEENIGEGTSVPIFMTRIEVENPERKEDDNPFNDDQQFYITLRDFCDILNKHVLLGDGKKPLAEISLQEGDHMDSPGSDLLCQAHPLQLSVNPTVCLIKNKAWLNPAAVGFADNFWDDYEWLQDVTGGDVNSKGLQKTYWYNDSYDKTQLGIIGNIYINLGYIYNLVTDPSLEDQDKKEKKEIALYDFLKNLMLGINASIGNLANFDVFSDPVDGKTRIVDINFNDPNRNPKPCKIEVHNLQSIVRSYKLESKIFPEQSTMIAIGAQAQGGALGSNTNTLVDFNQNLIDRIIEKKIAPDTPEGDNTLDAKLKNIKENIEIIMDFINTVDPSWFEFVGEYDVSQAAKYQNALKDLISLYQSFVENDNSNRALIPTSLNLEMDGIGGMVIGNMFKVNEDILPRGYKGGGAGPKNIGYIVTKLGHTIQGNDWKTDVETQFVIIDSPSENKKAKTLSLSDLQKLTVENQKLIKQSTTGTEGGNNNNNNNNNTTPTPKQTATPRKTEKCNTSYKIADPNKNSAWSNGLKDPTPWAQVKRSYPVLNRAFNVQSIGTPLDSGTNFVYKMKATKVSRRTAPAKYIAIHYTVSSIVDPTHHYRYTWEKAQASADFTIGRNGQIAGFRNYKNLYSWHYGDPTFPSFMNFQSVGIEMEALGYCTWCETTKKFLDPYNREVPANEVCPTPIFKGFNMWHKITDVQVSALCNLIIGIYNDGIIGDKTVFLANTGDKGRYDILFPERGLSTTPKPGIITHNTGRNNKSDIHPQGNMRQMLDELQTLIPASPNCKINWV